MRGYLILLQLTEESINILSQKDIGNSLKMRMYGFYGEKMLTKPKNCKIKAIIYTRY